jgi:hypothetical protein
MCVRGLGWVGSGVGWGLCVRCLEVGGEPFGYVPVEEPLHAAAAALMKGVRARWLKVMKGFWEEHVQMSSRLLAAGCPSPGLRCAGYPSLSWRLYTRAAHAGTCKYDCSCVAMGVTPFRM